jgi:Short C-terminal domain
LENTMPGLLRGIARTAVIAGTATSVSNRVSRRQAGRWSAHGQQQQEQQQYAQQPQQYAQQPQQYTQPPAAAPAPPADPMTQKMEQLKQLGDLKAQGVLTPAEFEEQKRRILG